MATVNATRMELTRLKGKLITATRGHKLLKDKRDELMREFLDLVRKNKALREKVEEDLKNANKNFVIARSTMSDETVRVAFMAPKQELTVEERPEPVMKEISIHTVLPLLQATLTLPFSLFQIFRRILSLLQR